MKSKTSFGRSGHGQSSLLAPKVRRICSECGFKDSSPVPPVSCPQCGWHDRESALSPLNVARPMANRKERRKHERLKRLQQRKVNKQIAREGRPEAS